MKKIAAFVIMLVSCAGICFGNEGRTAVSIMNITATSGITVAEAVQLTKKLLNELVLRDVYDVVDLDKRDEVLREQGFQQTGACDETSCLVEAGKLLGVKKIIGGCIGRIGSVYSVELQMVDVLTGKVEKVYSNQCSGDPARLLGLMKESSYTFAGMTVPPEKTVLPVTPPSEVIASQKNIPTGDDLLRGPVALSSGLAAFYPFNGNARDESGNKNHGNVKGAEFTSDRFNRTNRAYWFDGINDYILVPDAPSLDLTGAVSISAWIRPDVTPQSEGAAVICKGYGTGDEVYCLDITTYANTTLRFLIWTGGSYRQNMTTGWLTSGKVGQWINIVAVFDGNARKSWLFENGRLISSQSGYPSVLDCNDHPLSIGSREQRQGTGYNLCFKGAIDDLRIYNRVLNFDEIKALANEK